MLSCRTGPYAGTREVVLCDEYHSIAPLCIFTVKPSYIAAMKHAMRMHASPHQALFAFRVASFVVVSLPAYKHLLGLHTLQYISRRRSLYYARSRAILALMSANPAAALPGLALDTEPVPEANFPIRKLPIPTPAPEAGTPDPAGRVRGGIPSLGSTGAVRNEAGILAESVSLSVRNGIFGRGAAILLLVGSAEVGSARKVPAARGGIAERMAEATTEAGVERVRTAGALPLGAGTVDDAVLLDTRSDMLFVRVVGGGTERLVLATGTDGGGIDALPLVMLLEVPLAAVGAARLTVLDISEPNVRDAVAREGRAAADDAGAAGRMRGPAGASLLKDGFVEARADAADNPPLIGLLDSRDEGAEDSAPVVAERAIPPTPTDTLDEGLAVLRLLDAMEAVLPLRDVGGTPVVVRAEDAVEPFLIRAAVGTAVTLAGRVALVDGTGGALIFDEVLEVVEIVEATHCAEGAVFRLDNGRDLVASASERDTIPETGLAGDFSTCLIVVRPFAAVLALNTSASASSSVCPTASLGSRLIASLGPADNEMRLDLSPLSLLLPLNSPCSLVSSEGIPVASPAVPVLVRALNAPLSGLVSSTSRAAIEARTLAIRFSVSIRE